MTELRPSGFPEYSPSQQLIFDQLKETIEQSYQQFWYTHIHTPAVERNDVLLSKNGEETWKQIFGLYGIAQGAQDLKEYGLHFDLTVPFARYTLDWEHQLTFPFKRYQIQPVWRGERAQKGRYREFFQCDIDVIWKGKKDYFYEGKKDYFYEGEKDYFYYDAEIIATLGSTLNKILKSCGLQDTAVFHINNKKLVKAFLAEVSQDEEQMQQISTLIDKYKKIGTENFIATLREDPNISAENSEKILKFISFQSEKIEDCDQILDFADSEAFKEGVEELRTVLTLLKQIKEAMHLEFEWKIDLQIIRGLDYYTGTIFEAVLKNDEKLGSICGGGRYANLTGYIDPKRSDYCGVGGSIGISRLLGKIFELKEEKKQTVADYLFLHFEENFEEILKLAGTFAKRNQTFEIFPTAEKLGKQFAYADKKGIPYVIIYGQGEKEAGIYKIKDMKTWEETTYKL